MKTLGQIAYEAYGDDRKWKTANGAAMLAWGEQREDIRASWDAAAKAVLMGVPATTTTTTLPANVNMEPTTSEARRALLKAIIRACDGSYPASEAKAFAEAYRLMADAA